MNHMIPRVPLERQGPHYPAAGRLAAGLILSTLIRGRRSFVEDAHNAVMALRPALDVVGGEHVPASGACLVTCNHYSRPGFQTWWLAFAITAALADRRARGAREEILWVMTEVLRFEHSPWRHRILTPASRLVLSQVARAYGFVKMPAMPPVPEEAQQRAIAVLQTVRLARRLARTGGILCLAPEGRDVPVGLAEPPPGAGILIGLIAQAGMTVLPAAVTEADGRLSVRFGPAFAPEIPANRAARDVAVAGQVMDAIRSLLP